jgi:hypothetical protein
MEYVFEDACNVFARTVNNGNVDVDATGPVLPPPPPPPPHAASNATLAVASKSLIVFFIFSFSSKLSLMLC